MKRSTSIEQVLRKISKNEALNKQDKRGLKDLIYVLERALEDKSLTDKNRALINKTIQKSRKGTLTPVDYFVIAGELFNWIVLYKNSS